MTSEFDIAVVGNGMLGLSVADELLRREPGASVIVIGPASRPGAGSAAAGAMLGCFAEVTKDTFGSFAGRAKFDLSLDAHRRWPKRLEELAALAAARGERLHRVDGTYVVLNTAGGQIEASAFTAMLEALADAGEPWEEVPAAEVPGLNPGLTARPSRAVYLPDEGAIDARQVVNLLEYRVIAREGKICDARVRLLRPAKSGAPTILLVGASAILARTVVLAAGVWNAPLLRTFLPATSVMPIYAGVGVAVVCQRAVGSPFRSVVRTPTRSGGCGLHVVPLGGSREYVGATNLVFGRPQFEARVGSAHFLLGTAMAQLDRGLFAHHVSEWRIGNRPIPLDTFPTLGWTGVDGLYVVGGTYRDGLQCSPSLARHAAEEVLSGTKTSSTVFAPNRVPHATRTPEEAISAFVLHSVDAWFEFSGALPQFATTTDIEEMYAARAHHIHAQLGLTFGLAPEILMYLLDPTTPRNELHNLGAYLAESCESRSARRDSTPPSFTP